MHEWYIAAENHLIGFLKAWKSSRLDKWSGRPPNSGMEAGKAMGWAEEKCMQAMEKYRERAKGMLEQLRKMEARWREEKRMDRTNTIKKEKDQKRRMISTPNTDDDMDEQSAEENEYDMTYDGDSTGEEEKTSYQNRMNEETEEEDRGEAEGENVNDMDMDSNASTEEETGEGEEDDENTAGKEEGQTEKKGRQENQTQTRRPEKYGRAYRG